MFLQLSNKFTAGDYALVTWQCSDAITRETAYKVLTRTPKRATMAAIYPNGLDRPINVAIKSDGDREYAQHANTSYALIYAYKEDN